MKYKKMMKSVFAKRSNDGGYVAIAVVAGLAIGAVLVHLFKSENGDSMSNEINDRTNNPMSSNYHFRHNMVKKPKSDIRELIHETHTGDAHTEQGLS